MEKRISLECRGRDPKQVKDLNLDNCRSAAIVGLTDEYVNLEVLSLINVGLLSLKGFPNLPNLKRLELSDNRIYQELDRLSTSPNLTHLNLSGNKISDIATLEPLKDFKKLKNLDLFNNDVTSIEEYRNKVFQLIPTLKYLDGYDQEEHEADDSDAEDEELNGNNESSEEDEGLDIDFSNLTLDNEENETSDVSRTAPLPLVLYTIYGLIFHLGSILYTEEEEGDMSLRSLYNDKLAAEGSGSDFEVDAYSKNDSEYDEEEEDDEEWAEGDEDKGAENKNDESESTRGKKRTHDESEANN